MKISIEYRAPDAEGKRALRLTYYAGSYLDQTTGIRKHKRSRETLDLFLYDKLRILVKLNSDSGICEHHFRKVC
ncbi:hypothetical protein ACK31A_18435 [Aeromonas caviae]